MHQLAADKVELNCLAIWKMRESLSLHEQIASLVWVGGEEREKGGGSYKSCCEANPLSSSLSLGIRVHTYEIQSVLTMSSNVIYCYVFIPHWLSFLFVHLCFIVSLNCRLLGQLRVFTKCSCMLCYILFLSPSGIPDMVLAGSVHVPPKRYSPTFVFCRPYQIEYYKMQHSKLSIVISILSTTAQ